MIRIFIFSLLFISCKGKSTQTLKAAAVSYSIQVDNTLSDSLLIGIQDKIKNAFVQSLMVKNKKAISELELGLSELYKKKDQNIIQYWRSYLQFYTSIYYLQNGEKQESEKAIDKGINWLESMEKKNAEDYALLAMLQGFGIQFKGMKAMFISSDIKQNLKTAMAIDSTNLRVHYVSGSNDYHTPAKYGGGQKAEKYLLKAISLSSQKVKNDYLPSWGKEEAYEMLIKLYIKNQKWDLATKFYKEAIGYFPKSYTISMLASKLVGK